MTDVAVLGLQVDSRPVAAATTELNKLVPAAKAAEAATKGMEAAAAAAAGIFPKVADGAEKLAEAAVVAAKGHASLSTQAMAAQHAIRSFAEQIALGVPVTQALASHANQLAYAASGPGGLKKAFIDATSSLAGLLTPMRLLGAGAVAAGIAAYSLNAAWNSSALALDDTSRAIGTTINQLRGLERAAAIKGINDFAKDAERFAAAVYQARNGMGSLGDVLRANGERATDFTGTLEAASRILGRAVSDQQRLQLLQQMGLPATADWVRLLGQGGNNIRDALNDSGSFSTRQQELVDKARSFDESWSRGWQAFKNDAFDATTAAKGWLNDVQFAAARRLASWDRYFSGQNQRIGGAFFELQGLPLNSRLQTALDRRASQLRGDAPVVDPAALSRSLSLEQQRLGILGQTASVEQQVRLIEIQVAQARLNGVNITRSEESTLKNLTRERALGIDSIRAQTDAYKIEASTVGFSIEQAAAFTAREERLNQLRREGRIVTLANIADITRESEVLGRAAAAAETNRFQFDTFSGGLKDVAAGLRQGSNLWTSFGNAAGNALSKVEDRLLDIASRQLWSAAFPIGGGGLGSLFSGLFGGGGSSAIGNPTTLGGLYANGAAFRSPGLSAYSNQIVTRPTYFPINDGPIRAFATGTGLMGEAGPEAIMPLTRTASGKLGVRSTGGAGDIQVNVYNAPAGTTATSRQTQTPNGTRVDITLKRTVDDNSASLIASGDSGINKALENRYNLRPAL